MKTAALKIVSVNGHEYRQQTRQCNKPTCKCHNGNPHGPYWYVDTSHYVGKELPAALLVFLDQLAAKQDEIKKAIKAKRLERDDARQTLRLIDDELLALERLQHGDTTDQKELSRLGFADLIYHE